MISLGRALQATSLAPECHIETLCMDLPSLNAVNAASWVELVPKATRPVHMMIYHLMGRVVVFIRDAVLFLEEVKNIILSAFVV